jgi:hypothetical protein
MFRVVCAGKGFEDEFSDNSDLSFFTNRRCFTVVRDDITPRTKTKWNGLYDPLAKDGLPSQCTGTR